MRRHILALSLLLAPCARAAEQGRLTVNNIDLIEADADPRTSGVPAGIGSILTLEDGTGVFVKVTSPNTGWLRIAGSGGGSGVTPPFVMSKSGNATVGTYFRTGEAVTSVTGQLVKGSNYIVELEVSNGSAVGSTTRVQVQKRTAVSTFSDISGAFVDISSGQYKGATAINVAIGPDEELAAYVKSGSTLHEPILTIFCVPQ